METSDGWSIHDSLIIIVIPKVILIKSILYICQQQLNSIYSNVIICYILTHFLTLPSQPVLTSPLQNFITPNESLMSACCVCVCRFGISFTYVIESIESKLISVCLIKYYSLKVESQNFLDLVLV